MIQFPGVLISILLSLILPSKTSKIFRSCKSQQLHIFKQNTYDYVIFEHFHSLKHKVLNEIGQLNS